VFNQKEELLTKSSRATDLRGDITAAVSNQTMRDKLILLLCVGYCFMAFSQSGGADTAKQAARVNVSKNAEGGRQDITTNGDHSLIKTSANEAGIIRKDWIENVRRTLLALAIILSGFLYLLIARRVIVDVRLIQGFGGAGFLILFQLVNFLLDPMLKQATEDSFMITVLSLIAVAALLIPLHQKIMKWSTLRVTAKNKKIRLAAARKNSLQ
jgi:hypothetical protein